MKAIITKHEAKEIVLTLVMKNLEKINFDNVPELSRSNITLLNQAKEDLKVRLSEQYTFLKKV